MVSQPLPPADNEHRLHKEFNDRRRHIHEGERRKDKQKLMPECSCIMVLNGIEQVAIEEAEPHGDADLSLIDQHEENDHCHTDAPLWCCERTERPAASSPGVFGVDITVGAPRDLATRTRL